jgi:hypothetical protein
VGPSSGVRPALHQQLTQAIDVIRMEVGEQHRRDLPLRQPHARKHARRACADVNDIDTLAGDHRRARSRALRIRQRRAGAAKRHVEPVGKLIQQARGHVALHHPLHQPQGDGLPQRVAHHCQNDHETEHPESESLHSFFLPMT